jgi:SAM-dependent methyltransferase
MLFDFLSRVGEHRPFYKVSVKAKALLFSNRIKIEFWEDMEREYITMRNILPQKATSILDIGSGIAGINAFINKHYNNKIDIYLLDKTQTDERVYYYYHERGSVYNSLTLAKELLKQNGVDESRIHTQEATDDNQILIDTTFDIVVSLISWGFHYPVTTYLDVVYQKLKPKGVLIIDIRKETGGEKELKGKFGNATVIFETSKYWRVLAKKL